MTPAGKRSEPATPAGSSFRGTRSGIRGFRVSNGNGRCSARNHPVPPHRRRPGKKGVFCAVSEGAAVRHRKPLEPWPVSEGPHSKEGELFIFLGQVHFSLDEFDKAEKAIQDGIKKGKLNGFVTLDELNSALPPGEYTSEQIEDIHSAISEMGFNIIDQQEESALE